MTDSLLHDVDDELDMLEPARLKLNPFWNRRLLKSNFRFSKY